MESVPEKVEPILPVAAPTELPVANHVLDTSFTEEPAPAAVEQLPEEASDTLVNDETVDETPVEENVPEADADVASPEPDTEPEAPAKEMQQLEIATEDEKEVDTAEDAEHSGVTEAPQEEEMPEQEESNTPAVEEEAEADEDDEERYKHLKVTLTLPEQDKVVIKEQNEEKPTENDKVYAEDEKMVPDKPKDDKEKDLDSGNGSAADNSSVDLNLSISSFLSKTKEPGSVSIQVRHTSLNKISEIMSKMHLKTLLYGFLRTPGVKRRH